MRVRGRAGGHPSARRDGAGALRRRGSRRGGDAASPASRHGYQPAHKDDKRATETETPALRPPQRTHPAPSPPTRRRQARERSKNHKKTERKNNDTPPFFLFSPPPRLAHSRIR